jgi:hypothetical protein
MGMRVDSILLSVLLAFLVVVPCANAGLNMDPDAMPDGQGGFWRGTVEFAATGGILIAKADYAVYLPGSYGGSVTVPSDQYVYAYQIYSIDGVALTTFTVGLMDGSEAAAVGNGTDPLYGDPGGINPLMALVLPGTFNVTFLSPQLQPMNHSVVVLFTSPYGPMYTDTSVIEGGPSLQSYGAPTPIPEPVSLITFLGFTGLAVLRGGSKKAR